MSQLPRRSSESQPYTAGTSGHRATPRRTCSSIAKAANGKQQLLLFHLSDLAVLFGEVLLDARRHRFVVRELDRERALPRGDRFQARLVVAQLRQRDLGAYRHRSWRDCVGTADLPAL